MQILSRSGGCLGVVTTERGGALPGAVDQQQAEAEGPRADRGQEERHEAISLQKDVAGVRLPN